MVSSGRQHGQGSPAGRSGDRITLMLAGLALLSTAAAVAGELARVRGRGRLTSMKALDAADAAARHTAQVAVSHYRGASEAQKAFAGMLGSFACSFGCVRMVTHLIRKHGQLGPLHNLQVGRRHIHHFVPGILLAFISGGAAIVSRSERLTMWLALPFGTGLALTLDEAALLLDLDDVYWTEAGTVSVRIALGTLGGLSAATFGLGMLIRSEERN